MFDTITFQTEMVLEECCNCHMVYAVTNQFQEEMKRTHKSFCCPAGHNQHYSGESEIEKLRNALRIETELKEEIREDRNRIQKTLIAVKGHKTRIQKRIANGVCPCCNRSFGDLHNHMKTQHPKYVESEE